MCYILNYKFYRISILIKKFYICLINGGFDYEWDWRAAVEICVDKRSIAGINMRNLNIDNSLSNGLSVIAKNGDGQIGVLTNIPCKI
ncbi:hypothetical protein [Mucilaginibacter sp.]|uniref:hypothetical protein n=1 Tax=Mucilaginibacter sp. TaxID=1882438 RepID=UPI002618A602|nr:hypothetical protein [Mucilaginibacter sp.]MDB4927118.1 hypothetical protein [Mucilaginibacter sp.]